jgi:tripartite-type tricarboxylate transporter receptor subunit TctC
MNQPDATLERPRSSPAPRPSRDSVEYGSLGVGSGPHVVMEMMNNMAGIQMVHVAYKASPAGRT